MTGAIAQSALVLAVGEKTAPYSCFDEINVDQQS